MTEHTMVPLGEALPGEQHDPVAHAAMIEDVWRVVLEAQTWAMTGDGEMADSTLKRSGLCPGCLLAAYGELVTMAVAFGSMADDIRRTGVTPWPPDNERTLRCWGVLRDAVRAQRAELGEVPGG